MSSKLPKKIKALRKEFAFKNFKCKTSCFECCTAIEMTEVEKKRMDQSLRKQGIDKPPNGKGEKFCEYLGKDGKCSVYDERPIICRAFGRVNSAFLTCSYFREAKKIVQSKALMEYMAGKNGKMVQNTNSEHGLLMAKVREGDVGAIVATAQQVVMMFKSKMIDKATMDMNLGKLEEILQSKGDSLFNYTK